MMHGGSLLAGAPRLPAAKVCNERSSGPQVAPTRAAPARALPPGMRPRAGFAAPGCRRARPTAGDRLRKPSKAAARAEPGQEAAEEKSESEGPVYCPKANAEYWELRPATVANRLVEIGKKFGRWWFSAWVAAKRSAADAADGELPPMSSASAAQLREVLADLGPAFVKIGQAVASRPDLLPPSYLAELEKLHDQIPCFPTSEALAVIEEEFGCSPSEVFSSLTTEPVAAASLGQVYRGILKSTGQTVAVKVQRPGVLESISLDLYLMRRLAATLRGYFKTNSDLPALLDEWGASLYQELDYTREAANGTRFRMLFGSLPEVYVPLMMQAWTTPRVLVMEWVEGTKINAETAKGGAATADTLRLVEVGVRCSLEQMLEEGVYHADPHRGNLLRMTDGRLAYLDFGMMGEIDLPIRQGLIRATLHLVNREYLELADDFVMLGLLPPDADRNEVVPALTGVFQQALKDGVANLSFGQLSGDLGRTMYKFKFQIPPYYTLLVRSLSVLEGIALTSDKDYKVLASAYPWIARRLLTDDDPVLRDTLQSLLYASDGRFQFHRLESLLVQAAKSPARAALVPDPTPPQRQLQQGSSSTQLARAPAASGPLGFPLPFPFPGPDLLLSCFTDGKSWWERNQAKQQQGEAATGGPLTDGSISLILSHEGEFIRNIMTEEIARGIDAAIRLQIDTNVQGFKDSLLAVLGVPGREKEVLAGKFHDYPGNSLVQAVISLPGAAEDGDREQLEGLSRLAAQLQGLAGKEASGLPGSGEALSERGAQISSITEAAALLRWIVTEVSQLPAQQRIEALGIPVILAQKVSSRITARTIRATVILEHDLAEQLGRLADIESLQTWAARVAPDSANPGPVEAGSATSP